jgi:quercetin dioxygenase-like cupin family protein
MTPVRWTLALLMIAMSGRAATEVKLDAPQARAVLITLEPNTRHVAHQLPMGGIVVFLGSGSVTVNSSGQVQAFLFKNGDFRWLAGETSYENLGKTAIRFVEIELKAKPQGPLPPTDLDPIKTDPEHYKAEFENDQVRVLRVRYGPGEMGALHEHKLNRVVCYVTDHPGLKAGSVRIAGPATHTEENRADYAVERVAVELK